MESCQQTHGMNVLQHGLSVNMYFHDLRNHILKGTPLEFEWKLPEWINDPFLWDSLIDLEHLNQYQIYHDCGKPFCLTIDEEGKSHFPNHAEVSSIIWRSLGKPEIETYLMAHDMDIHLLKSENLDEFCNLPHALTLLLTGFCEIHSNSSMFGGIDSTSFKIKWKKINKLGNKIIQSIKLKEIQHA